MRRMSACSDLAVSAIRGSGWWADAAKLLAFSDNSSIIAMIRRRPCCCWRSGTAVSVARTIRVRFSLYASLPPLSLEPNRTSIRSPASKESSCSSSSTLDLARHCHAVGALSMTAVSTTPDRRSMSPLPTRISIQASRNGISSRTLHCIAKLSSRLTNVCISLGDSQPIVGGLSVSGMTAMLCGRVPCSRDSLPSSATLTPSLCFTSMAGDS